MHEARAPSKLPALFASQLSATKVKRSNANPTIQGGILGVEKEGGNNHALGGTVLPLRNATRVGERASSSKTISITISFPKAAPVRLSGRASERGRKCATNEIVVCERDGHRMAWMAVTERGRKYIF